MKHDKKLKTKILDIVMVVSLAISTIPKIVYGGFQDPTDIWSLVILVYLCVRVFYLDYLSKSDK